MYLPDGGEARVDLSAMNGSASVEWLDPSTGERARSTVDATEDTHLVAPFEGDAVALVMHGPAGARRP